MLQPHHVGVLSLLPVSVIVFSVRSHGHLWNEANLRLVSIGIELTIVGCPKSSNSLQPL